MNLLESIKNIQAINKIPSQLKKNTFRFVLLGKAGTDKAKIPFEKEWQNKNNYSFDNPKLVKHIINGFNFGVIGGYGNLRILDIDNPELAQELEKQIDTYTVKTGSGGRHFYFISDYDTNHVLINGLGELRARNYQVVSAPCKHPSGNYYEIINNTEIKTISQEDLLNLIKPYLKDEKSIEIIDKNKKEDTSRSGLEYRKVIALLREGKSREEIYKIMSSYSKWKESEEQYKTLTFEKAESYVLSQKEELDKPINRNFDSILIKDLIEEYSDYKDKSIIKKFIPEKSLIIAFGETGSLKSFFINYLGSCIASGKKFLNKYPVIKKPVLLISTENPKKTDSKRFKAVLKGLGINFKRRKNENFNYHYLGRNNISSLNDFGFYATLENKIIENKIGFLIIDTISPLFSDINDNLASEIVKIFNEKLFPLIDKYDLSIFLTIHTQKTGKDYLGSVKIKASSDVFYEVFRDNDIITLLCHKNREGEYNLKIKVNFNNRDEKLNKISFDYLQEFSGKQTVKTKGNDVVKINEVKELITSLLDSQELKYNQIITECKSGGYAVSTIKRAIKELYETKKIKKNPEKDRGYYIT